MNTEAPDIDQPTGSQRGRRRLLAGAGFMVLTPGVAGITDLLLPGGIAAPIALILCAGTGLALILVSGHTQSGDSEGGGSTDGGGD